MSETSLRIVLNGIESDWINLKRGVPQGNILGLMLFNIYVNDLAKILEKDCTVVQYADDTFLFKSDTDEISSIFAKSQLVVNNKKKQDILCSAPGRG